MASQNNLVDYTIYADSNTREAKYVDNPENFDDNPTNDITIITDFNQRLNVNQVTLGSLEMSLAQYNIEPRWQELYFDEGIDLFVTDHPALEDLIKFSIYENGTTYTAHLPPKLNPIINVTESGTDYGGGTYKRFTFETQYPHCLHLMDIYLEQLLGQPPFKIISTPLNNLYYYDVSTLNTENITLTILSDTQFRVDFSNVSLGLDALAPFSAPVTGIFGYLSSSHIPDLNVLALLLTAAMNHEIPNHWLISYSVQTGKFSIKWRGPTFEAITSSPAYLLIPNTHCLPFLMGLGYSDKLLPIPDHNSYKPLTDLQLITQHGVINDQASALVGQDCFRCRSKIQIDPGNYRPEQLMSNISRQLNRFYFDGGCQYANDPWYFVYSTQCGECFSVIIPFGTYAPDTLAAYIQDQIRNFSVVAGRVTDMQIDWDLDAGQFMFSSNTNFGLEFDRSTGDLALRMGFYPLSYRNSSLYRSPRPFYFPTKGCCNGQFSLSDNTILQVPLRNLSYIYVPVVIESERKFVIQISKPRPLTMKGLPVHDEIKNTLTFTSNLPNDTPVAHGYQRFDVVEVIGQDGQNHSFVVIDVPAFNQFVVDAGSLDPSQVFAIPDGPLPNTCATLGDIITTNIYFTCLNSKVLPKVLGFPEEDYLWSFATGKDMWFAPAQFTLDWPNYILIEITEPNGATRNCHNWEGDKKPKILAKAILYPQYRLERGLPVSMQLPDFRFVNRVHIRLLNPDHTLYEMHGKEWSLTLIFKCLEKTLGPMCF